MLGFQRPFLFFQTIGDLFATIYKALGIEWEKTYMTPNGRPIKIANSLGHATGIPIKEII